MKRKSVAAVLSALVFPGVGQYYLGQRVRALAFLVPAAVAGYVYLHFALDQATTLMDQVMGGNVALDPAAIAARIEGQPTPTGVAVAGYVFAIAWIGSVIDPLLPRKR